MGREVLKCQESPALDLLLSWSSSAGDGFSFCFQNKQRAFYFTRSPGLGVSRERGFGSLRVNMHAQGFAFRLEDAPWSGWWWQQEDSSLCPPAPLHVCVESWESC